jgi:TolB-like protein
MLTNRRATLGLLGLLGLSACASTQSVTIPARGANAPAVAIIPFDGHLGTQAVDLISQQLAAAGIGVVERARLRTNIGIDTDVAAGAPVEASALSALGQELGVNYLFAGTVSAEDGPLYSFPHVNMTLRLIDVRTGQTRWIGTYGNPLWTSAISQQGDLQRGTRDLVREFIRAGGPSLLEQ